MLIAKKALNTRVPHISLEMRKYDADGTAIQGMINPLEAVEMDIRQGILERYEDFDQKAPETRRKLAEMIRSAQRLAPTLITATLSAAANISDLRKSSSY